MTPRDRRAIAVGITCVALAVLGLRIAPRALEWRSAVIERVQRHQAHVQRIRADLENVPMLEDSARALRGRYVALAPQLVGGHSAPDATAELIAVVGSALGEEGADIERIVPVADTALVAGLHRVGVRADLVSDAQGLGRVLRRLGAISPVIEVTGLRVTAGDPRARSAVPERLSVSLTARGWWLERRDTTSREST